MENENGEAEARSSYDLHRWACGDTDLTTDQVLSLMGKTDVERALVAIIQRNRLLSSSIEQLIALVVHLLNQLSEEAALYISQRIGRRLLQYATHPREYDPNRHLYIRAFIRLGLKTDGKGHFYYAQLKKCGHVLLDAGKLTADVRQALTAAIKVTNALRKQQRHQMRYRLLLAMMYLILPLQTSIQRDYYHAILKCAREIWCIGVKEPLSFKKSEELQDFFQTCLKMQGSTPKRDHTGKESSSHIDAGVYLPGRLIDGHQV